ncbi:hypothetical protein POTOM_001305 [Populus tomentosa]|uniref:Thioredoxin domain-containing protein n=1 Tax=Populus tomentosa TaxID=118781 RepID=A0A8X8IVD0_POPTO|nr:hypothetical protein POTOM_001305 [Populus tomentosa]
MRGSNKALLVRALIFGSHRSSMNSFSRRLHENLISNPGKTSHPSKPLSNFTTKFHFSTPYPQLFQRTLSSSSSSSGKALISSTFFLFIILWCFNAAYEELNSGLKNVQEKSSPAVFYFTATWCGPCKFISPVIEELSKKYPHATIYKVDIDTEGLQNALANLNIAAVSVLRNGWAYGSNLSDLSLLLQPTLDFYKNGKKETTIVGADVAKLKNTMESLYSSRVTCAQSLALLSYPGRFALTYFTTLDNLSKFSLKGWGGLREDAKIKGLVLQMDREGV